MRSPSQRPAGTNPSRPGGGPGLLLAAIQVTATLLVLVVTIVGSPRLPRQRLGAVRRGLWLQNLAVMRDRRQTAWPSPA